MSDSIMLVCAVLAALALGVLTAYGVCLGFFRVFRMRAAAQAASAPGVVAAQVVRG